MDEKTFRVFKEVLYDDGYGIIPSRTGGIRVTISHRNEQSRYHHYIMAFRAEKKGSAFLVIKSLQHPARIFEVEYAQRIGKAIRLAAEQIWNNDVVHFEIDVQ